MSTIRQCVVCVLSTYSASLVAIGLLTAPDDVFAAPWASQVVSYALGSGGDPLYSDPAAVLGSPARYTGDGQWAGAVTPFNPSYNTDQIVSLGAGGHLTVQFDRPITDDASHPYDVDFLVFGNGGFFDKQYPDGIVGGLFQDGPFSISISQNGTDFIPLVGEHYDGMFPTLGYLDLIGPYDPDPGSVPTSFTKPVNPALDIGAFVGKSFAEVVTMYDGSGGGIPFDIHSTGLTEVYYVRIDVPEGGTSPEFDAFAIVPEPATAVLAVFGVVVVLRLGRHARERRGTLRLAMHGTALAPLALLTLVGQATAQDGWRHYAGNSERLAITNQAPQDLSAILWVASQNPVGTNIVFEGQSSPVVYNGRAYAVARHYSGSTWIKDKLMAFELDTGAVAFEAHVNKAVSDSWSSPAIDSLNNVVLIGSGNMLFGIDAASGEIKWYTELSNAVVNASAVVAEDLPHRRAFITDYVGFGTGGQLYCINISPYEQPDNPFYPGDIVWQETLGGTSGNTPAYHDGAVYVASVSDTSGGWPSKGVIYAFAVDAPSPETRLLWSWTFDAGESGAGFFGGVCCSAGFIYAATYNFYGSGDNSQLVKLRAADGQRQWVVPCERTNSIPVVAGDRVYLSAGIQGYGSIPKIQAFEDHGSYATKIWDTGGHLVVGGLTHQPILSGSILWAGAIPVSGNSFAPCTDLYMLDVTKTPSDLAAFVVDHRQGMGSSPACDAGRSYTIGAGGLYAIAARGDFCSSNGISDGQVDGSDIRCFLEALISGDPAPSDVILGDFDGDGQLTANDVAGFVAKLIAP